MREQTAAPQRLFLRRLAALIVDFLAFGILATIVLGALIATIPQLRDGVASSFFYPRSCVSADTSLPVFAAIESSAAKAEAGGGTTIVQDCTIDSLILPQKHIAAVAEAGRARTS